MLLINIVVDENQDFWRWKKRFAKWETGINLLLSVAALFPNQNFVI